jgi:hypothetical protein
LNPGPTNWWANPTLLRSSDFHGRLLPILEIIVSLEEIEGLHDPPQQLVRHVADPAFDPPGVDVLT